MLKLEEFYVFNHRFTFGPITCEVREGECVFVAGRNGSGKTTFLLGLAGLLPQLAEEFSLAGIDMRTLPAYKRPFSLVFQKINLFPHLSVGKNIHFFLRHRLGKVDEQQLAKVRSQFRLDHLWDKKPHELSGGEYQLAALTRALCWNPTVVLLDEPFTALDAEKNQLLEAIIYELKSQKKIIFLTSHQIEQGIRLCDQMIQLEDGKITFWGRQVDAFRRFKLLPRFSSAFSNLFSVRKVIKHDEVYQVVLQHDVVVYSSVDPPVGAKFVKIDPADILLSRQRQKTTALNQFEGKIVSAQLMDGLVLVQVQTLLPLSVLITRSSWENHKFQLGETVIAYFKASHVNWFSSPW